MFSLLKNLFLNSFIVTRATGIISSLQSPPSLLIQRSPDRNQSLQYRTTNFRNFPTGAKYDDIRKRPSINIFCQNSACDKQHNSPSPYITKQQMYVERKLQKQFIGPTYFMSVNKKKVNVSPNDLLSYCLKFSLTSPKPSGNNLPALTLCCHPPFHTHPRCQQKYPPCPPSLALPCPKPSPYKVLPDIPQHCSYGRALDDPSCPPWPPLIVPPCRTICRQPCDSYKNIRLLKLPQCSSSYPPEYPGPCPPPPLCPPIYSPKPPRCRLRSESRPNPKRRELVFDFKKNLVFSLLFNTKM